MFVLYALSPTHHDEMAMGDFKTMEPAIQHANQLHKTLKTVGIEMAVVRAEERVWTTFGGINHAQ